MKTILEELKASGIQVGGEEKAYSYLAEAADIQQAILALAKQGRSIGVTFSSNPIQLNVPAAKAVLTRIGLNENQVGIFFANVSILPAQ